MEGETQQRRSTSRWRPSSERLEDRRRVFVFTGRLSNQPSFPPRDGSPLLGRVHILSSPLLLLFSAFSPEVF